MSGSSSHRNSWLWFACSWAAIVTACDQPKATPSESVEAQAIAQPPPRGLRVDDAPIATRNFALGTEGESSYRLIMATKETTCEELRAAYPNRPKPKAGEQIDFWAIKPLEKDGSQPHWTVRSSYFTNTTGSRGLLTRAGDITDLSQNAAQVTVGQLELALQDRKNAGRLFQWNGPLEATWCKRVKRPEKARPQDDLQLAISGKTFPVSGASIRVEGAKHYLRLTRSAHACDSAFTEGYDFYLDLALEGSPPRVAFASLQGDLFPESPAGSSGKEKFVVKIKDLDRKTDEVEIQVDGELVAQGYPIRLQGKANALRCTPKDP